MKFKKIAGVLLGAVGTVLAEHEPSWNYHTRGNVLFIYMYKKNILFAIVGAM